jgi:hypothetical protein
MAHAHSQLFESAEYESLSCWRFEYGTVSLVGQPMVYGKGILGAYVTVTSQNVLYGCRVPKGQLLPSCVEQCSTVMNEDWISRARRRCSKAVAGGAVHAAKGTIPSVSPWRCGQEY